MSDFKLAERSGMLFLSLDRSYDRQALCCKVTADFPFSSGFLCLLEEQRVS